MHPRSLILSIAAILTAMFSIQFGAALAKGLFPVMGTVGATTLRLVLAAALLAAVFRPWRGPPLAGHRGALLGYGAALGFMNLFYYLALARIPMGIVVAIEFLGPLGVAIAHSHRAVDFLWALLAVTGLTLLLPLGADAVRLDPVGLGCALLAGAGWGAYIVVGTRVGLSQGEGARSVALGMLIAAAVVLPVGAVVSGPRLLNIGLLPLGLAVAVLSSALPYVMEMYAMMRMPTRAFGIFMSIEPAIAALFGFALLGERLTPLQCVAIGCVMIASFGSALSSTRTTA